MILVIDFLKLLYVRLFHEHRRVNDCMRHCKDGVLPSVEHRMSHRRVGPLIKRHLASPAAVKCCAEQKLMNNVQVAHKVPDKPESLCFLEC